MSARPEALHGDNSSVTGIVDRLEGAGRAERRPDERDRRVKAVVLTETVSFSRARKRAPRPGPITRSSRMRSAATSWTGGCSTRRSSGPT
jgi:hypothetical protein